MTHTNTKAIPANGTLLRARRLELRLGTRDLARRAGTTFTTVKFIEENNAVASHFTLAETRNIAAAAGLSLLDLLTPRDTSDPVQALADPDRHAMPAVHRSRTAPTPNVDDDSSASGPTDAVTLAQVLAGITSLVEKADLCDALNWTFPRLQRAQSLLQGRLQPLGLEVHEAPTGIAVRSAAPVSDRLAKVLERHEADTGLTSTQARILREGVTNTIPDLLRDADKPSLGYLTRVGIVRPGKKGEPASVLTEDAAFAFAVPDTPPVGPTTKVATPRRTNTSGLRP